jgi:hypothetical protein
MPPGGDNPGPFPTPGGGGCDPVSILIHSKMGGQGQRYPMDESTR